MRSAMPPSGESSPRSNLKSRLSPIKRLEAKKETTQGKRETAPRSKPRSRFRPQPQAGLIASLRDERLLTDLFLQRVMSRSQLQVLHCSAEPSCNAQLRQLFDWRFLSRLYLPTAPFGSQALYSVGKAAVPLVTARLAREGLALELDDIRIQCHRQPCRFWRTRWRSATSTPPCSRPSPRSRRLRWSDGCPNGSAGMNTKCAAMRKSRRRGAGGERSVCGSFWHKLIPNSGGDDRHETGGQPVDAGPARRMRPVLVHHAEGSAAGWPPGSDLAVSVRR